MVTQLFAIPLRILVVAATLPTPPALGAITTGVSTAQVAMRDAGEHQRSVPVASMAIPPVFSAPDR